MAEIVTEARLVGTSASNTAIILIQEKLKKLKFLRDTYKECASALPGKHTILLDINLFLEIALPSSKSSGGTLVVDQDKGLNNLKKLYDEIAIKIPGGATTPSGVKILDKLKNIRQEKDKKDEEEEINQGRELDPYHRNPVRD